MFDISPAEKNGATDYKDKNSFIVGDICSKNISNECVYSCAYYFYNLTNKQKNISKAYRIIHQFPFNKTNYSEPMKYSDPWKLKGDIQNRLNDSINKTEANYAYAIYYDLNNNTNRTYKDIAHKYISLFLDQVYRENMSEIKNSPENINHSLARAWKMKEKLTGNETEKKLSRAFSYYSIGDINNSTLLDIEKSYYDYWFLQGLIRQKNSDFPEAAISFKKATYAEDSLISNISTFNKSDCDSRLGYCLIRSPNMGEKSEGYYRLANLHWKLGQASLSEINQSIAYNISNHDAWNLRGEMFIGNNSDAANYSFAYSKYLRNDLRDLENILNKGDLDNYIDVWILRGKIFEKIGDNKSSYSAYKNATQKTLKLLLDGSKNESYSFAYLRLGRIEAISGNYTEAKDYFYKSLNNNSTNYETWVDIASALFYMGEFEEAQNIFNFSFSTSKFLNGSNRNMYWNRKGEILASRGWFNASLPCFNNSTNETQYFRKAWYNKGLAKININNLEGAIRDFDNATLLVSGNESDNKDIRAKAWMNKAVANSTLKRYSDALIDVDEAIKINPSTETLANVYYTKGLILLALEQPLEANRSFFQSLSLNDSKTKSKTLHGLGRALQMKGDYKNALIFYTQSINKDGNNEQAWIDKGKTEQLLGMKGESLISFHNALDAIKRNRARVWCDLGYAWRLLPDSQNISFNMEGVTDNLSAFNKSIQLDEYLIEAYYNKSNVLLSIKDYENALAILKEAAKLNKSLNEKSEYNYYMGIIYLGKNDRNSSFKALCKSYNSSRFNIQLIYCLYNNFLNESNSCSYINKNLLQSMKNISQSNSRENALPTIDDFKLLQEKLNQSKKLESDLLFSIAGSKYGLNLTDEAIQSFIMARKISNLQGTEISYQNTITILYWLFIIIGIFYLLLILLNVLKAKVAWILIISNSIGFLTFAYLLSFVFDASRALWSLGLQGLIFLILSTFFLIVFNYRDWKWLVKAESVLRNLTIKQIYFCRLSYILIFFIVILISFFIPFIYIHIQSNNGSIINPHSFIIVRSLMFLILGILIPITTIPIGLVIASGKVDSDLRKIFASVQFVYLSMSSVPLVWLFWSYGMPIDFSTKISIEDKVITLPLYSITLSILFFIAFIYPYFKGQKRYEHVLSKIIDKQEEWISRAEKNPNDTGNLIEDIYREMIREIKCFFGNRQFCASRGFLNAFDKSNCVDDWQNGEKNFLRLKELLDSEGLWDEDDSKGRLMINSQRIIQIIEDNKKKDEFRPLDNKTIINPSALPLRISMGFGDLKNQFIFENSLLIDPFASIKNDISQSRIKISSDLWRSYITIFISPVITLAIGWIVSIMRIPVDNGDLSQLISGAVSSSSMFLFP